MKSIYKNWLIHNVIGHPLMQVSNMIGLIGIAKMIHDGTLPEDL